MLGLILILASAGISGLIVYLVLRPKLKSRIQFDEQAYAQNQQLIESIKFLEDTKDKLHENVTILEGRHIQLTTELSGLQNTIQIVEQQAQEAADLFYNTKMQVAQENLAKSLEEEAQKYQENVASFQVQYDETVAGLMEQYKQLEGNVALMRATNDAAVAAAKRAEELKNQQDYYRIQLSAADLHEIELLREVEPYLRDKEPLNKVIWKCYYEKPTTDMIGRVVGSGVHTGIYKLTEIATGKCYVGQAANIADRWKQHIKRGVGADTPTRNKLYPAMIAAGPENFTFEIVEECDRTLLDEREDFWQDYFKAKEFGYSIK